jgi:hypothetical protein
MSGRAWALAAAVLAALLVLTGGRGPARADTDDVAATLADAGRAAERGDWGAVEAALAPLERPGTALRDADRAEVFRLRGLVAYFAGRHADADAAWLAYLRLELDGRLDPGSVPPEAVTFFESVRSRHGAELRALRPRPRPPRTWWMLNLVPAAGQLQNREPLKAWLVGSAFVAALGANLASYALLRRWCDDTDGTCDGHGDDARTLRGLNLATGVAAIAVYALSVADGLRGMRVRRAQAREEAALVLAPTPGGAALAYGRRF